MYASTLIFRVFVEISLSRAPFSVFFIQASAGLSLPLIHHTLEISFLSYASLKDMMSIISLFSSVVSSLTRQLYNNLESIQITTKILGIFRQVITWFSVVLSAMPLSNPVIILYSSLASTLLVTRLHFVEL